MSGGLTPFHSDRGSRLLWEHCTALTRVGEDRPDAFGRLERAVGGDLARLLVVALAGRKRAGTLVA